MPESPPKRAGPPPGAGAASPRGTSTRDQTKLARKHQGEPTELTVAGIGASAGGLDACRKFLSALPAGNGMAFIFVQHLDPTHESLMVDLLASHTVMRVLQAAEGMTIEPDHLYVIPPGTYLSVVNRMLHLSQPEARHGARLPFDFLLNSMALEYGKHAVCVVLSGTGSDGSTGLRAIKDNGGLVIVQRPAEADFDGMPRSALATGAADMELPVAEIPDALMQYNGRSKLGTALAPPVQIAQSPAWLPAIIDLLRSNTAHDFRLYKHGTLQRRIERQREAHAWRLESQCRLSTFA